MGKLFSRSSKSSDAKSDNPYAQTPASQDPYADNSSKTSMSSYSSKSASGLPSGPRAGLPSGPRGGAPAPRPGPARPPPSQQPPPSYGSSVSGGYAPNKFGSGGGYGANRYQNEQSFQQNQNAPVTSQPFRPGGYGGLGGADVRSQHSSGLGRMDSSSTDVNRGDLFGGAKDRFDPQRGTPYDPTTKPVTGYGQSGTSAVGSGSYGGYGEERELTQEEQDELEVDNIKAQKKQVKGESAAAVQRIVQMTDSMLDTQNDTTARLAYQGEMLGNADKNMDLAQSHNVSGYDKARELQTVNRSMFAVHVANPFTAKKRAQARDDAVMDRHRAEKQQREETRRNHYQHGQMFQNQSREMRDLENNMSTFERRPPGTKSRYEYEDDEEEQQYEETIEEGLDLVGQRMNILKLGAMQQNATLDEQNRIIEKIGTKTDRVDDGVRRNRHELDKVR